MTNPFIPWQPDMGFLTTSQAAETPSGTMPPNPTMPWDLFLGSNAENGLSIENRLHSSGGSMPQKFNSYRSQVMDITANTQMRYNSGRMGVDSANSRSTNHDEYGINSSGLATETYFLEQRWFHGNTEDIFWKLIQQWDSFRTKTNDHSIQRQGPVYGTASLQTSSNANKRKRGSNSHSDGVAEASLASSKRRQNEQSPVDIVPHNNANHPPYQYLLTTGAGMMYEMISNNLAFSGGGGPGINDVRCGLCQLFDHHLNRLPKHSQSTSTGSYQPLFVSQDMNPGQSMGGINQQQRHSQWTPTGTYQPPSNGPDRSLGQGTGGLNQRPKRSERTRRGSYQPQSKRPNRNRGQSKGGSGQDKKLTGNQALADGPERLVIDPMRNWEYQKYGSHLARGIIQASEDSSPAEGRYDLADNRFPSIGQRMEQPDSNDQEQESLLSEFEQSESGPQRESSFDSLFEDSGYGG